MNSGTQKVSSVRSAYELAKDSFNDNWKDRNCHLSTGTTRTIDGKTYYIFNILDSQETVVGQISVSEDGVVQIMDNSNPQNTQTDIPDNDPTLQDEVVGLNESSN
ncbi:MAG: hypothetical protein BZ136_04825 [Methanosphaera sp. rholeuAM74]|nr:MAG: hypothetical protein BZ136_04825 [Methanosphaera sp. rholeuAM74]